MFARLSSAVAASIVVAGFIAAGGACSSDPEATPGGSSSGSTGSTGTSGSSGSSGTTPSISSAECNSRCSGKLTECEAPASIAEQACTQLCGGDGITEGQATCLEEKECEELEALGSGGSLDDVCPKSSGGSSSGSTSGGTSGSTSGNTSSGGTNDTPTNLTITGTIPNDYKAIHTKSDDTIASLFSVAPEPTFDPDVQISAAHLPLLDKAGSVTLDSPDRPSGACGSSKFSFVLNSSQIGVQIAGTDELPDTACATFIDELVKGATFTLKNVPWNNSDVKATVKIVLK